MNHARIGAVVLAIGALFVAASCQQAAAPCSPADTLMAQHAAECALRVRLECAHVPDDQCMAIRECDAWGEERCGMTGASGAP